MKTNLLSVIFIIFGGILGWIQFVIKLVPGSFVIMEGPSLVTYNLMFCIAISLVYAMCYLFPWVHRSQGKMKKFFLAGASFLSVILLMCSAVLITFIFDIEKVVQKIQFLFSSTSIVINIPWLDFFLRIITALIIFGLMILGIWLLDYQRKQCGKRILIFYE